MTLYRTTLEMLAGNYKACFGDNACVKHYNYLSLLFNLLHCNTLFKRVDTQLKEHLSIGIDSDVDYRHWGDMATWTNLRAGQTDRDPQPTAAGTQCPPCMDDIIQHAFNHLSELATLDPDSPGALSPRELKQLQNDFRATYSADRPFDDNIHRLLELLCNTLLGIAETLEAPHEARLQRELYYDLSRKYGQQCGAAVRKEYATWKGRHLEEKVTEDSLHNFLEMEMISLFGSGALDDIVANASRQQMAAYRQEVNFSDLEVPADMHPDTLYSRLRGIYDYQDGTYSVNWTKAGQLLFLLRHDTARLKALLHFDRMVMLVNGDTDRMRGKSAAIAQTADFDPAKVHCRFSADEVRRSGIKRHPDIALAVIDQMRDMEHKAWWMCFYCVLLKRGWIEKNIKRFCESMKALFDINLDRRMFNAYERKYGTDVNRWPVNDGRMKEKRDFALRFQACLDACVNHRLGDL